MTFAGHEISYWLYSYSTLHEFALKKKLMTYINIKRQSQTKMQSFNGSNSGFSLV